MAQVLEGSGEGQVVGLRGCGQDVVHPLGPLYSDMGGSGAAQSVYRHKQHGVIHWERQGQGEGRCGGWGAGRTGSLGVAGSGCLKVNKSVGTFYFPTLCLFPPPSVHE